MVKMYGCGDGGLANVRPSICQLGAELLEGRENV